MARISGIDLPKNKRGVIGLTYIYGIGRSTAEKILADSGIDESKKVSEWNDDDLARNAARLEVWRTSQSGDGGAGLERLRAALDDDLDTPSAIAILDEESSAGRSVRAGAALLGIDL